MIIRIPDVELDAVAGGDEVHFAGSEQAVADARDVRAEQVGEGEEEGDDGGGGGGGDAVGGGEDDVGFAVGGAPDLGGGAVAGGEGDEASRGGERGMLARWWHGGGADGAEWSGNAVGDVAG